MYSIYQDFGFGYELAFTTRDKKTAADFSRRPFTLVIHNA